MNKYHSEEATLQRVANILGIDVVEAEIDDYDCYAFTKLEDHSEILYGPVVDGEPLFKEGVADHLLTILNEMDPNELITRPIYNVLEKDEFGDWAYVYAMAEIMTISDDFCTDFCEETKVAAAQQIINTLIEIVEEVLE